MKNIMSFLVLAALVLTVSAGFFVLGQPKAAAVPEGYNAVVRVDDGDTIEVEIDGRKEKVRLIGVDTPETVDPRRPIQCFGKEASKHTKSLASGSAVKLERDAIRVTEDRDKYHRLLRYVYLPNGTLLNEELIRNGFGHEYTYHNQPYQHQAEFKTAEREARQAKRGLWAETTCHGDTKQPA